MNESRGICVSEAIVSLFCFIGLPTQPSDNVGILMYFTYLCVGVYVLYVIEIDIWGYTLLKIQFSIMKQQQSAAHFL